MSDFLTVFVFLMAVGLLTLCLAWLRVRWVLKHLEESDERVREYRAELKRNSPVR